MASKTAGEGASGMDADYADRVKYPASILRWSACQGALTAPDWRRRARRAGHANDPRTPAGAAGRDLSGRGPVAPERLLQGAAAPRGPGLVLAGRCAAVRCGAAAVRVAPAAARRHRRAGPGPAPRTARGPLVPGFAAVHVC